MFSFRCSYWDEEFGYVDTSAGGEVGGLLFPRGVGDAAGGEEVEFGIVTHRRIGGRPGEAWDVGLSGG